MKWVRARIDKAHIPRSEEILRRVNQLQRELIRGADSQQALDSLLTFMLNETGYASGFVAELKRPNQDDNSGRLAADSAFAEFSLRALVASTKSRGASNVNVRPTANLSLPADWLELAAPTQVCSSDLGGEIHLPFLGSAKFAQLYVAPISEDGVVTGLVVLAGDVPISFDIDELDPLLECFEAILFSRRMQELGGAALALNTALMEVVPDAVFLTTRSGRILDFQRPVDSSIHVERSRLLGQSHRDLFSHEFCDRWDAMVALVFETGRAQSLSCTLMIHGEAREFESRVARCGEDQVITLARDTTLRVATEHNLQRVQSRMALLLNEMPAVLWSLDRDLRFTTSVGKGLSDLGLKPGEVVGMALAEFLGDSPSATMILEKHKAALGGRIVQYEVEFGSRVYHSRVEPILNATGEIDGCMGVALDVTETRYAEQARRNSEEQWKAVVENVPDHILVLDEQGVIRFINRISDGWTAEQVIGSSIFDFNPQESHETIRSAISKVFTTGETVVYESVGRGGPDDWRNYVCRMAPMTVRGEPSLAILVASDVTDYLAVKKAEQRHYSLLKSVTNGLPDMIFIKDLEGRLVFVNEAIASLNGKASSEIIGKTDFDMMPEELASKIQKYDHRVYETNASVTYEEWLPMPIGDRCFLTTKIPWRDAAGRVIGLLGIARDISEQRAHEETIERQRSQLFHVSRLTTIGQMTAEISHEVKQPLSAIANYAGTCLLGLDKATLSDEQHRQYLSLIAAQAKRADAIMERMRGFARRGKPTRSICNVRDLVHESIDVIGTELKENRVSVKSWLPATEVLIEIDRVLMQQVIVNLLMNACEAMKEQPTVDRRLEIRCEFDEATVSVAVVDCGSGLGQDVIARVFETFFTTKGSRHGNRFGNLQRDRRIAPRQDRSVR